MWYLLHRHGHIFDYKQFLINATTTKEANIDHTEDTLSFQEKSHNHILVKKNPNYCITLITTPSILLYPF
jgi:hypothetical protein